MSTTQKAMKDRMEADSWLTSKGVLSKPDTSRDAEWWAELTRQSILEGSLTSEAYSVPSEPELPEAKQAGTPAGSQRP